MGVLRAPLGAKAVHLCIDMQRLFAPDGPWPAPWMERVLPTVVRMAERSGPRTVFTRFLTASSIATAPGSWQAFYRKWPHLTRDRIDPALLDLVAELQRFAPSAATFDRSTYSAFANGALHGYLRGRDVTTLVVTGSETDVCVLATVLAAVDLGYRVVIAKDAVCSSSDATHDALLKLYGGRFDIQIELATSGEILDAWPPDQVA